MIKMIDMRRDKDNSLFDRLISRDRVGKEDVVRVVDEILSSVRARGDEALLEYTRRFDRVELDAASMRVSEQEMKEAYDLLDPEMLEVIRRSKANIESFHEKQKENSWFSTQDDGVLLGQLYRPLEIVGIYVPGGTAVLTSTVLMNGLPAKVAGVERIIMATPPGKDGSIDPGVLVAAQEAGVTEIYKMGGAQAVAAMVFGTQTVPRVDKIFGPGNIYVSTAKRLVYGYCDIDMFAGPSEITVVADDSANPAYVAADLLSQAEHDILSASILVTPSQKLAEEVVGEIEKQAARLPRKSILEKSLADYGAAVIVNDLDEAMDIVNRIAPEHLELCIEEPFSRLAYVRNAGAIFLGHWSPEPLGDYFAGPNHVLPTGGTARFFSPLTVADYMKKSSVISYTRKALEKVSEDVVRFAEYESLDGHANAIKVRFG
ncbi:MAG: histidinol dehydrogenase [Clostridiaceae bacterium]|jgi:histidinol dehydrogenase|nr:histidinol dehydrogenase [Clostridiaceae bacterium]